MPDHDGEHRKASSSAGQPPDGAASALPIALPRPPLDVVEDVVDDVVVRADWLAGEKHLRTCPVCVNPALPLENYNFDYVPNWFYVVALLNPILGTLLFPVARRRVRGQLPLCEECVEEDATAKGLDVLSVVGLAFFPTMFSSIGTALAGLTGLIYGAAVGTVSGVVGVIAARRRFRTGVVRCVYIDRKRSAVTLRASCRLKIALLREAPEALADVDGGVQPTRPTGRGR